jgi:hypothetical protein
MRNSGMNRLLLIGFVLVSAGAHAQERRIEAIRIDASSPGAVPLAAPNDAVQGDRSDARPAPALPHSSDERRSSGGGLPLHIGVMGGPSAPRPLEGEVYIRAFGFFMAGFSYSDFPAFIADPLLSLAGLNNGTTTFRLDKFSAMEGEIRLFPFAGDLFVGSSFGRQTFNATVTQQTGTGTATGTLAIGTTFATPRIGYLWTLGPVVIGMDAGVQLKLSSDPQISLPPGAPPDMQSQAQKAVDLVGNGPLPSFHLRLGFQY